jgi:hypothetical protein
MLWKEAAGDKVGTQRVFTRLTKTKNLVGLEFFLELGADVEVRLPAFDIKTLAGDEVGAELEQLAPTPLLVVAAIERCQSPILRPVEWPIQPLACCAVGRDGPVAPGPQF